MASSNIKGKPVVSVRDQLGYCGTSPWKFHVVLSFCGVIVRTTNICRYETSRNILDLVFHQCAINFTLWLKLFQIHPPRILQVCQLLRFDIPSSGASGSVSWWCVQGGSRGFNNKNSTGDGNTEKQSSGTEPKGILCC